MYELLSAVAFPGTVAVILTIDHVARKLFRKIEADHRTTMQRLQSQSI